MQQVKNDIQILLPCPTCKRRTLQAHLEGDEFWCTICAEVHALAPGSFEMLQFTLDDMSAWQHAIKRLIGAKA